MNFDKTTGEIIASKKPVSFDSSSDSITNSNILMLGWEFPPLKNGGLGVACFGLLCGFGQINYPVDFALPYKMETTKTGEGQKFHFMDQPGEGKFQSNAKENAGNQDNNFKTDFYSGKKFLSFNIPGENILATSYNNSFVKDMPLMDQVKLYAQNTIKYLVLNNLAYKLIHAHDWLTAVAAIEINKIFGTPFIFHIHATEWDRAGEFGNLEIREIELEAVKLAQKIVCVSNYTKNIVLKHYNGIAEKIEIIHNGIDSDLYELIGKDLLALESNSKGLENLLDLINLKDIGYKFVLFVGRLTFQKGVEFLLEAAKMVKKHHNQCIFLITGRGDMETELIDTAAKMGLGDSVIFCGWQNDNFLSALYTIADVFVMPSRSEPFGLVALEAAIHKTPVIISKTSGAAEVMPHSLQVDHWDVGKISHYILSIITYRPLSNVLSSLAASHVGGLDWKTAAGKLAEIYDKSIY